MQKEKETVLAERQRIRNKLGPLIPRIEYNKDGKELHQCSECHEISGTNLIITHKYECPYNLLY